MEDVRILHEDVAQKSLTAYMSYSTFVTFLEWLRDMPDIPDQIDRSLWGGKFAGSTGTQLMSGLRFLNLLEGDRPRAELREIVRSDRAARKTLIQALLRNAYGSDLVENLATKTPRMLDERLLALGTSSATHKKAVSFFVNAARDNDITVPANIGKQARNRPAKARTPRAKLSSRQNNEEQVRVDSEVSKPESPEKRGIQALAHKNLHMAVVAMLQDLEQLVPDWSESQREKWLATFQVTLNYAYPVKVESEEAEIYDRD